MGGGLLRPGVAYHPYLRGRTSSRVLVHHARPGVVHRHTCRLVGRWFASGEGHRGLESTPRATCLLAGVQPAVFHGAKIPKNPFRVLPGHHASRLGSYSYRAQRTPFSSPNHSSPSDKFDQVRLPARARIPSTRRKHRATSVGVWVRLDHGTDASHQDTIAKAQTGHQDRASQVPRQVVPVVATPKSTAGVVNRVGQVVV